MVEPAGQAVDKATSRGLEPRARRDRLSPDVRSMFVDAAAIATLRADLHELGADLHEVAASVHQMRAHEHVEAFLDGVGDPVLHRRSTERHRAAAAADRASAERARRRAEKKRREADQYRNRL